MFNICVGDLTNRALVFELEMIVLNSLELSGEFLPAQQADLQPLACLHLLDEKIVLVRCSPVRAAGLLLIARICPLARASAPEPATRLTR